MQFLSESKGLINPNSLSLLLYNYCPKNAIEFHVLSQERGSEESHGIAAF
jgi:hypothetical protein